MSASQTKWALLLAFAAAVCVELQQAQHTVGRCSCPSFSRIPRSNITDFQLREKSPACNRVELIVTRIRAENSTEICINPLGRIGLRLSKCWERINKNVTRKSECIENLWGGGRSQPPTPTPTPK